MKTLFNDIVQQLTDPWWQLVGGRRATAETLAVRNYLDRVAVYYATGSRPYAPLGFLERTYQLGYPQDLMRAGAISVVTGPPGSGKTTLLDWLAFTAASERSCVPIFVSLHNYTSSLRDLLTVSIRRFGENLDPHSILTSRLQRVFLLDGYDEIPAPLHERAEKDVLELVDHSNRHSVVITSRKFPDSFRERSWNHVVIAPLNDYQIRVRLDEEKEGHELWELLNREADLLRLVRLPLFLETIIRAWRRRDDARSYLLAQIPRYTAWRGHSKSLLPHDISYSLIDEALVWLALHCAVHEKHTFDTTTIKHAVAKTNVPHEVSSKLFDAVVSTDVMVQVGEGAFAFVHRSLAEMYAARGMALTFRHSKQSASDLITEVGSNEANGNIIRLFILLLTDSEKREVYRLVRVEGYRHWSSVIQSVWRSLAPGIRGEAPGAQYEFLEAVANACEERAESTKAKRLITIVTLPGFNTHAKWIDRFTIEVNFQSARDDDVAYVVWTWDYNPFRFGILSRRARQAIIDEFQRAYNNAEQRSRAEQVNCEMCIVAHSFGTFISGHAIRRFPEVKPKRILFVGSALPRTFNWGESLSNVEKLLNILGAADWVLFLARFVPGLGDAGSHGFTIKPDKINEIRNEFGEHSDCFGSNFMATTWIPFIRDGRITKAGGPYSPV